jgi:hypothetical protein
MQGELPADRDAHETHFTPDTKSVMEVAKGLTEIRAAKPMILDQTGKVDKTRVSSKDPDGGRDASDVGSFCLTCGREVKAQDPEFYTLDDPQIIDSTTHNPIPRKT